MSDPSVELRIHRGGKDSMPHSFLLVTNPDGTTAEFGFGPLVEGGLAGAGEIKITVGRSYSSSTGKIPLDLAAYNRLMTFVNESIKSPPPYYLPSGSQSANWAAKALVSAGVSGLGDSKMLPDSFVRDLIETLLWNPYSQAVDTKVTEQFNQSRASIAYTDPIALDLDGDGIETIGIRATTHVLFDHNGDGIKTGSGWLKGDDAWLVLDRDANGRIDKGNELFGVDTMMSNGRKASNGFEALADLDRNRDGVLNSRDARYKQLQLWRDLDQDGVSDDGELQSLADAGISGIGVRSTAGTLRLGNGNVQSATANYTRADGSTGKVATLDLASNPFYRAFDSKISLTAEAAKLPDLSGSGVVRDLREAASIAPKLVDEINSFKGLSRADMMSRLDTFLQHWAETSDFKTSREQVAEMGVMLLFQPAGVSAAEMRAIALLRQPEYVKSEVLSSLGISEARYGIVLAQVTELGRTIEVLEAFNGQTFVDFSDSRSFRMANGSAITLESPSLNKSGATGSSNAAGSALAVPERFAVTPVTTADQINPLKNSYVALKESVYQSLVVQTRLTDYVKALSAKIDDKGFSLDFSALDSRFDAHFKIDPIRTFTDCLDLQRNGDGLSRLGWQGAAKLISWSLELNSSGKMPALKAGLAEAFATSNSGVPNFMLGTGSGDSLSGMSTDDFMAGLGGNDYLYGREGNDVLDGGTGNDVLYGGGGNDLYVFRRGYGQDSINNYDTGLGKIDAIRFADDIASTSVAAVRNGNDLVLRLAGSADQVTVSNYFYNDAADPYKLEEIRFAGGTVWTVDMVKALVQRSTGGDDLLHGYAVNDVLGGGEGNDTLYGYDGDDTLSGHAGRDCLYGGDGADVLNGGAGDDYLSGNKGSDTYLFGRGDGKDVIYNYDSGTGKIDAIRFADDIASTSVAAVRNGNDLVLRLAGSADQVTVSNYFYNDAADLYKLEEIRFAGGTVWTVDMVKALVQRSTGGDDLLHGYAVNDVLGGGEGNDTLYGYDGDDTLSGHAGRDCLYGGDGADVLNGGAGDDSIYGGSGSDRLIGEDGNDVLRGESGNDILKGGNGNDYLDDSSGNAIFDGGAGDDKISGGSGIEFYIGGRGNDTLNTGAGDDVIMFNTGDGKDTFAFGGSGSDTLSFGGRDLRYENMTLARSGSDLIFRLNQNDQISFTSWYAPTSAKPVAKLQVVAEAMPGYLQGGRDPLKDQKFETFDFKGIVAAFDQARAMNPKLSTWQLSKVLPAFQTGGSDTQALGGDVAYQYGLIGSLDAVNALALFDTIS